VVASVATTAGSAMSGSAATIVVMTGSAVRGSDPTIVAAATTGVGAAVADTAVQIRVSAPRPSRKAAHTAVTLVRLASYG
jgi:hypothetical protein